MCLLKEILKIQSDKQRTNKERLSICMREILEFSFIGIDIKNIFSL